MQSSPPPATLALYSTFPPCFRWVREMPRRRCDLLYDQLNLVTAARVLVRGNRVIVTEIVVDQMTDAVAVRLERRFYIAHQSRRRIKSTMIAVPLRRKRESSLIKVLVRNADNEKSADLENAKPFADGGTRVIDVLEAMAREDRILGTAGKRQCFSIKPGIVEINTDRLRHNGQNVSSRTPYIRYPGSRLRTGTCR